MRCAAALLAVLLVAAAPTEPRFDPADAFRSVLPKEQAQALSGQSDLIALAQALNPGQREAAAEKLRDAEGQTSDPRDLAAIHRGYLALKDADGAWRVGDSLAARFPQGSVGFVMRGQAAELRGDMAGVVQQAREALRRDPNDRAAFALLKLSEGRASSTPSDTAPASADFSVGEFDTAPKSGASPEALAMMQSAVDARRQRDFVRAKAFAQAAMRADPKSLTVQRFYADVEEDVRKVVRERVGLYVAIERHEAQARARREAAADLAAARRAARRNQVPPIAPLGAGALLLTLGVMAWNHGLRDEAQRQADEARRVAAAGLIVLGCANIAYGASSLLLRGLTTLGPPALVPAGGAGTVVVPAALPAATPVAVGVTEVAVGAKAALEDLTSQASTPGGDGGARSVRPSSAGGMQKQVERGQAPRSVDRVDRARRPHEKDQVHFKDGSALNRDGTWKHGGRALTNAEKDWLFENGWILPE